MAELFTLDNLLDLFMLVMLQAVLGFDNLLYITLEAKGAPKEKQDMVRKVGIALAVMLRIALLFVLISLIESTQKVLFTIDIGFVHGMFNMHSLIVLAGGIFIMYTAVKEIFHFTNLDIAHEEAAIKKRSVGGIITLIVLMNLVFSFDSILSAIALTDVFAVMATAIIIGGILMIWLAGKVAVFLEKNRMYEVLGLFVLFIVGIMLISEGGHLAHLELFSNQVTPMGKTTFYFSIAILVLVELVQGRYQKKLMREKRPSHITESKE